MIPYPFHILVDACIKDSDENIIANFITIMRNTSTHP